MRMGGCREQGAQLRNLLDTGRLHPAKATGTGLEQVFGDCWEWTASPYLSYPGYKILSGGLMPSEMVLRGGSCVTAADHVRATYRNCLSPMAQWQFTGIRLAH